MYLLDATSFTDGVTGIISSVTTVANWVWSLFSDLLTMIIQNPLIAFPVLFAVLAGGVAVVLKMVRKFGLKGKR